MNLTPAEIVSLFASTTPDLSARIGIIDRVWQAETHKIEGRFFYVRFKDGKPAIDELVDIVHDRIINFCIPPARISAATAEILANPHRVDCLVELTREARDLFIKTYDETGRSGELGEILLYMLLEYVLQAPIIANKMYLKTSPQMPIHGVDGIHLGFKNDNLIMYLGESKLHQKFASAIADIARSISDFTSDSTKYKNEVRLLKASLDVNNLTQEAKDELKKYFDPYKEESNKLINCYACLAGFDSNLYKKDCEEKFCNTYEKNIEKFGNLITKHVVKKKIESFRFSYFLLPFPSVEIARETFQSRLRGKS